MRNSIVLTLFLISSASTQNVWTQMQKIETDDNTGWFGTSVDISGNAMYMIVGAMREDSFKGAAYIYKRYGDDTNDENIWDRHVDLIGPALSADDYFGISVAIDGDWAAVGSSGYDDSGLNQVGRVVVYKRSGSDWNQHSILMASDKGAGDEFGHHVAIGGNNYIVVGAEKDEGSKGAVYVFKLNDDGTQWVQSQKLTASDAAAGDRFGHHLDISDSHLIVGAQENDDGGDKSGSAYIFVNRAGTFSEQAKLRASDEAAGDEFGHHVSIDNDYAIVGAEFDDDVKTNSGSAYIFKRSVNSWPQQAKISQPDPGAGDAFGHHVSIDYNPISSEYYALVGAHTDENTWANGDYNLGSAYIFKLNGTSWTHYQKVHASDSDQGDLFGQDVAIADGWAVIPSYRNGGYRDNTNTFIQGNKGSVYTFKNVPDIIEPYITITAVNSSNTAVSDGSSTGDASLELTFTSSEPTSDFAVEDVSVTGTANSVLSNFSAVSSTVYTATLTPANDGTSIVGVKNASYTDSDGNANSEFFISQTVSSGGGGSPSHYQTFTAPRNIPLDYIQVYHGFPHTAEARTIKLKLYQGDGVGGTLLGEANNTHTGLAQSGGFGDKADYYTYYFNGQNINFTKDQVYTWQISFSGSQTTGWLDFSGRNPYPFGYGQYGSNSIDYDYLFKIPQEDSFYWTYVDQSPPIITSTTIANDNSTVSVTMNEAVFNTNSASGNLEVSDFSFSLSGGVATLSSTTPSSISQNGNIYTLGISLVGTPTGDETLTVNPFTNSIYDAKGNIASTSQSNNTVKLNEMLPPRITSTTISNDNSTIAVTFNELVYNATGGNGALEVSDFTLSVTGGVATVASLPSSISINDKVVTLGLNITGTPDGSEKLVVVPSSPTAIYDASSIAASIIQYNNSVFLNDKAPPTLISVSSTKENGLYGIGRAMDIDITFSEIVNVTGNPQLTLETGENDVTINYNDGTGTVKLTFNYVVSEGDTSSDLDYINSSALAVIGGAIKDVAGNTSLLVLPSPGAANSLGANKDLVIDGVRPIIEKVTMTKRNENVEVKMSELVYNTGQGSGELEISDFKYALEGGTASLISFAPFTISKKDSTYTLDLQVQGYANGDEELTVKPVEKSIYDLAGNEMKTLQDSNTVYLLESIPPMITDATLAVDNSTVDVTFSEEPFSTDNGSGDLEVTDFTFSISGGVATLVSNNPSTITGSGKTFTLGISLSTLADGNEKLTINPVDDSIYDALGNESLTKQSNNVVRLNDFVAPSVTNVIGVENNIISPTENAYIQLVISEQLASAKVDVVSKLGDSIIDSYLIQKDRINITLEAGFVSGDSIEITAEALTDISNNIGIKNTYKYYVSILGDYNNDNSIDISDLNNFVSAWKAKSLSYELGPVTGTAPHFKPNVDGVFNARDGMAFYRMWHWDYGRVGKMKAKMGPQIGQDLNSRVIRDKLMIQPPKGTHASELIINYLPNEIQIKPLSMNTQTDLPISLAKQDTSLGELITNHIHSINEAIVFDINDLRVEQALIQISYRYIDEENQIMGSGYDEILLSPVPEEFALHQNYPNPFNPITTIQYDIPYQTDIRLIIFDILGREVTQLVDQTLDAGYHSTIWNGQDSFGLPVSAGVYFFQLQSNDFIKTQKMILLK